MSRVLTFSRVFPAYHPKAGQSTHFVEKLWAAWSDRGHPIDAIDFTSLHVDFDVYYNGLRKYQTIRAGNRWKVGDKFSPRVWSGKAYRSKQVVIGPDIEVRKVWSIEIKANDKILIDSCDFGIFCEVDPDVVKLAKNDGLDIVDLLNWFPNTKDFSGQIICWNENIEY